MELESQLSQVKSRDDLVRFVEALRVDLQKNSDRWENGSLEAFLEAMSGWIADMDQYYRNRGEVIPENQPWNLFATILTAARTYE